MVSVFVCHYRDLEFECSYKEGFLSTRTSCTTGKIASHYRHLEFEWTYDEGRALKSTRTTRTSRTTGETASHYRHLESEWSYDEGRALVNSHDSYEWCNW